MLDINYSEGQNYHIINMALNLFEELSNSYSMTIT
jgi:hypothetical protein